MAQSLTHCPMSYALEREGISCTDQNNNVLLGEPHLVPIGVSHIGIAEDGAKRCQRVFCIPLFNGLLHTNQLIHSIFHFARTLGFNAISLLFVSIWFMRLEKWNCQFQRLRAQGKKRRRTREERNEILECARHSDRQIFRPRSPALRTAYIY